MSDSRRPFKLLEQPVPPFHLSSENTVLILHDMQRFTVDRNGGIAQRARIRGVLAEFDYYFRSVNFILGKIDSILRRCRELNMQIVHLRLVSDRNEQSSFDPNFQHGDILPENKEDELFLEEIVRFIKYTN